MSDGVAQSTFWQPSPALRPYVERYVGYRLAGFPPGTHQGLPSRYLTLIISLGPPVDVAVMPDPAQSPGAFDALVGGLHASAATIAHDGFQYGIHLDVTPFGARALLGLPAGALASTVVGLDDVVGPCAVEWVERLREATTWTERFSALDELLLRRAPFEARPPAAEVTWAWKRLVAANGAVDVATLATEVGWSRRHLSERFRQEVGLPPKVTARVLRFERARRLLERDERPGLAEVAATCGYYDQAHLTREWRELAGLTPTAWIAEELPSVQDIAVAVGAG